MKLQERLEDRLALPGDSQTRRQKKLVAFLAGMAGTLLAIPTAYFYYISGATEAAILYGLLLLYMPMSLIIFLWRPQWYYQIVFITSLIVTVHPWLIHNVTGGFTSGLMMTVWSLFGPVSALLMIGMRPALINAGVLLLCALATALIGPERQIDPLEISDRMRMLMGFFHIIGLSLMIFITSLYLVRQMEFAQQTAETLLHNMLPVSIARELTHNSDTIARQHEEVTVLFADIVDFTRLSVDADPVAIVRVLNAIFSDFDDLADKYGLEKIKTVGDAYMVVCGLPDPRPDHTEAVAAFAIELMHLVNQHRDWHGNPMCLSVGINTGPVVAGVIGHRKFTYDLWGDTVNTASRMEEYGLDNEIQVTEAVRQKLDGRYDFEPRDPIDIKGKGLMQTYLLRPLA